MRKDQKDQKAREEAFLDGGRVAGSDLAAARRNAQQWCEAAQAASERVRELEAENEAMRAEIEQLRRQLDSGQRQP